MLKRKLITAGTVAGIIDGVKLLHKKFVKKEELGKDDIKEFAVCVGVSMATAGISYGITHLLGGTSDE